MGKLKINGDLLLTGSISFQTSNCITPAFSASVDSNGYGQNLLIGAGGNTVIGGGESASAFFTASGIKDEENLYLTADGSIHVYTNCDTIANRKLIMSMGADGNITTTGTIITPGNDSVVIKPALNNYDQIGAADCKFWKVFATTFYGNLSGNADTATTASAVAWGNVTGKPSTFTPSSHTHNTLTAGGEGGTASVRTADYTSTVLTGGWSSNEAGYGWTYGTTLDISGFSTWYHRLAFRTDGNIEYWQGINTKTMTKVGNLCFTDHSHSSYLPLSGGTLTGNLTMDLTKTIILRAAEAWRAGIGYDTQGHECIALWAKNSVTRLRWYAGTDMTNMAANTMMGITPDFEISKASGTAIGYIGGNTILHSNNYTSYTVTKTGSGASGTWEINITGKSGYTGDGDVNLIPGNSNEINFGGNYTANSSIYFGYRQKDSRPVPTHYYFGKDGKGATVIAGTFQGNATSATTATTAETATYVSDYGNPSAKIKIGLSGAGVTTTSYFAVYTTDGGYNAIKDMNVATVKSFLGIDDKLSKSGDTLNGTIILGKNDDYGMYPDTSNYCQLGRSDHKFWKMFAAYGFFDTIVTTQRGTDVPTRTDLPVGSIYFRTI